jgi:signal transduction histidine kinase
VGHPIEQVLSPGGFAKLKGNVERVLRGERVSYEVENVFKGLGRRVVAATYVPTVDPAGKADGWVAVIQDVTEARRRESAISDQRSRELAATRHQLHEVTARLLQTQDEERRRIARELHDGAGQLVVALMLNISNVLTDPNLSGASTVSLKDCTLLLKEIGETIRTTSYLLHPPLLGDLGLESALRGYVPVSPNAAVYLLGWTSQLSRRAFRKISPWRRFGLSKKRSLTVCGANLLGGKLLPN